MQCLQKYIYSYEILLLEMIIRTQPTIEMHFGGLNLLKWFKRVFPNIVNVRILGSLEGIFKRRKPIKMSLLGNLPKVGFLDPKQWF